VRTPWISAAALVAIVLASSDAGAFCRTTTSSIPAGYDPTVRGCWTQGSPIAWLWDERVPYELDAAASRQITLADATLAADQAFARWSSVQCDGGPPNVTAYDDGPVDASSVAVDCSTTPCDPTQPGAYHLIVFRDDGWAYDDPSNTLALTTVTYGIDTAVLFDAEIEINSHDHTLTTQQPPPPGAFDLQTILTHEAGHFFGLAHATSDTAVMYAYYGQEARELTADDAAGLCAAYPAHGSAGISALPTLSCRLGRSRSGGGSAAIGGALLALAWARRRR
jgi:Matrixin